MVRFLTSSENMSTNSFFVLHFVMIYNFIYTTANYNMAGINFIDKTDLRVLNFGPVVKDKVLNTSIFAAHEGKTRNQCTFACTSTSGCVSYNFGSNGGICQLCSEEVDSCVLVSKPGFIHHGIFNFPIKKCIPVSFNVSVTSGWQEGEFVVGEEHFKLEKHGNNFMLLNKDGTVYSKDHFFDMSHLDKPDETAEDLSAMNAFIDACPDDVIVLMAVVAEGHLPKTGVGNIPALGSKYTAGDLVGKESWVLIGYKGGDEPWITEALEVTQPLTRKVTINVLIKP